MKLVETTITEAHVRMRLSDAEDRTKATEWIDIQIKRSDLKRASGTSVSNLDDLNLPLIQAIILENAQAALDAGTGRLRSL
jgi:hypothetical protein